MWRIEEVELRTAQFDFTGSGLGTGRVTQAFADGVRLANQLEHIEQDRIATQVEICECCGCTGCESGGMVVFRRLGDGVAWVPAWDAIFRDPTAGLHAPPDYCRSRGVPWLTRAAWDELRRFARLPGVEELLDMDSAELARDCQLRAPARLLGTPPDRPLVRRELLLPIPGFDIERDSASVERCLASWLDSPRPVTILEPPRTFTPLDFVLDVRGTPIWHAFGHTDEGELVYRDECGVFLGPEDARRRL